MDVGTNLAETMAHSGASDVVPSSVPVGPADAPGIDSQARELGMQLRSLSSFFNTRNHPFTEADRTTILTRDFASEARIAQTTLLRSSQLILGLARREISVPLMEATEANAPDTAVFAGRSAPVYISASERSLIELAESLSDARSVCSALLEARAVSFDAWSSFGRILKRELDRSEAARQYIRAARQLAAAELQPALLALAQQLSPPALSADVVIIFTDLARLLERLRFIETALRRDHPLKQTLPVFTLVHEESRILLELIETRALRTEGLDTAIFDTLDGTGYAISMELRKVFAHELVGLSGLHQAPPVYAKVENAHGLLRDCFQQSTVAIAQIFDPTYDGAQLFNAFRTKSDQSLALRKDLWTLLQLVQQAEKERDRRPVAPLLERLIMFRDGSLRYLMYKDWESYERFVEEVAAAHGAVELGPVLHRFGAYLETLFGQINMRAVLASHPFDYPGVES